MDRKGVDPGTVYQAEVLRKAVLRTVGALHSDFTNLFLLEQMNLKMK